MTLPIINKPIFETEIISQDKTVKFNPYGVIEEKILLTAAESNDIKDHMNSLLSVIDSALIDKIDLTKLKEYDLDWLWVQLTIRSVSDISTISVTLPSKNNIELDIDLNKVFVDVTEDRNNTVCVGDGVYIELSDINIYDMLSIKESDIDIIYTKLLSKIYDNENFYDPKNYSESELIDFVSGFSKDVRDSINTFIETAPKVVYETTIKDKTVVDGKPVYKDVDIKLKGLADFF